MKSFASIPPHLTSVLAVTSLVAAVLAGIDYIIIPVEQARLLSEVEAAIPLNWWGAYMLAASATAVIGWMFDRWWLTAIGHAAIAGIYAAFGIGVILTVIAAGDYYGWRPGFNRLCIAALHVVLASAAWLRWDAIREDSESPER